MTIEIITEATDLAALHTHAANRCQVLQVRLRQLCREVATTTAVATQPEQPATTPPAAVLPTQPRPAAPVAEKRTSLIRPGMTIPAGDVDPEDESLYI